MKHLILGLAVVAMGGAVFAMPPLAQNPCYHLFADQRTLAGVPEMLYLLAGLAAYGIAKVLEFFDDAIFSAGHLVSGHTLKHIAAAVAIGWIALMLRPQEDS